MEGKSRSYLDCGGGRGGGSVSILGIGNRLRLLIGKYGKIYGRERWNRVGEVIWILLWMVVDVK